MRERVDERGWGIDRDEDRSSSHWSPVTVTNYVRPLRRNCYGIAQTINESALLCIYESKEGVHDDDGGGRVVDGWVCVLCTSALEDVIRTCHATRHPQKEPRALGSQSTRLHDGHGMMDMAFPPLRINGPDEMARARGLSRLGRAVPLSHSH